MFRTFTALLWACCVMVVTAHHHAIRAPLPTAPKPGKILPYGCYASFSSVSFQQASNFNTIGYCTQLCKASGHSVAAAQGNQCLCSALFPLGAEKADEARCNTLCPGYPIETCGGRGSYSLWSTGLEQEEVSHPDDEAKSIHSDDALWIDIGGLGQAAGEAAKSAQHLLSNRLGSH